jgi:hypothetical protein
MSPSVERSTVYEIDTPTRVAQPGVGHIFPAPVLKVEVGAAWLAEANKSLLFKIGLSLSIRGAEPPAYLNIFANRLTSFPCLTRGKHGF